VVEKMWLFTPSPIPFPASEEGGSPHDSGTQLPLPAGGEGIEGWGEQRNDTHHVIFGCYQLFNNE